MPDAPTWRISRARLALLAAAALSVAVLAWLLRSEPPVRLRLGTAPQVISGPLHLAVVSGEFARQGLEVTLVPYASGRQALAALLAGELDLASAAETPLTAAALADRPVRVWATLAESRRAASVIARGDRGVRTAADLKGKRVAYARGTTSEVYLVAFLELHGLGGAEVERIDCPPQEVGSRLAAGEVDAACIWEPLASHVLQELQDPVELHEDYLYRMTWNLISRADAPRQQAVIERVLRAIDRANQRMAVGDEAVVGEVARWCGMPAERVAAMLPDHHFRLQMEGSLLRDMEHQARILSPPGTPLPDVLALFDASALRAVQPDAVSIPDHAPR